MGDLSVDPGAARPVHTAAAHRVAQAPAAPLGQAKPGGWGNTAGSATTPPVLEPAKPSPELSPDEAAHAAETAVDEVRAARADLKAFDASDSSKLPHARQAREAKERQLHVLEASAISAATASCKTQMYLVQSAFVDLQIAEDKMEKHIAAGGSASSPEIARKLADAHSDYRRACINAEHAVELQKRAEKTLKGNAEATRHYFSIRLEQRAAAKMALKDAQRQPNPEATRINAAQSDVAIAANQLWDAAVEQRRAVQAWADDVQPFGRSEDISKSVAWVDEAKLDLQIAQPQGEIF
jgi:hypothetical protein